MKKGDKIIFIFIISIIIVSSILSYLYYKSDDSDKLIATIKKDGEIIKTIDLYKTNNEEYTIEDENVLVVIEVKDSKIRFKYSNCPDKLCEKAGYIYKKGQFVVCLPNKIIIEIIGEDKNVDDVSY